MFKHEDLLPYMDGPEWGQIIKEVQGKYNDIKKINGIMYLRNIKDEGNDISAYYRFNSQGKLYSIKYIFSQEHENSILYVDDYEHIQLGLELKFEENLEYKFEDFNTWSNEQYKDDPYGWGTAVLLGQLELKSQVSYWNGEIIHKLTGGHNIVYKF